jgi:hypothetical protein
MSEETYSTELPDRFSELGFDEGDWEMFVFKVPMYDPDKLVKLYLNISRKPPYSSGWRTEAAAFRSKDYAKMHAIARDTMELYSPELIVTDLTDSTDSNTMSDDYVDNKWPIPAAGGKRRRTKRRQTKRRKSRRRKTRRSRR